MFASKLRVAAVAVGATLSLSACVGPYGDIGLGYGSGGYYGGYGSGGYYGGYGSYGSPYGYSPYGYSSYGYSPYSYSPYGGWYDNYYYPGSGYYVYSRDGSRQRWSDSQRRYWEQHRRDRTRDGTVHVHSPVTATTSGTSTDRWRHRDRTQSSPGVTSTTTTSDRSRWTGRRGSSTDGTVSNGGRRGRHRNSSGD